ncbi:MAG: hypothetical protein KDI68_08385 [Gammaproteobacteria bacterium]|nr:hypothetical protein [Gammaproteobacteria bacterium]
MIEELHRLYRRIGWLTGLAWLLALAPLRVDAHGFIPIPLESVNALLEQTAGGTAATGRPFTPEEVDAFPPVESDLQDFLGPDRARSALAGRRLEARGKTALPSIEAALSDPATSAIDNIRLKLVVARIAAPGSQRLIIEATERQRPDLDGDPRALKNLLAGTFSMLSMFTDHEPASDYAQRLLSSADDRPVIVAQALRQLARHKVRSAAHWYQRFSADDQDLDVRYAALYLGGMLGIESSREKIVELLRNRPDRKRSHKNEEFQLLLALGEITTPAELTDIIGTVFGPQNFFDPELSRKAVNLAKLKRGDARQRAEAAEAFLDGWSKDRGSLVASLRRMIEAGDAQPYLYRWRLRNPVLVHHLARLGYVIELDKGRAAFVQQEEAAARQTPARLAEALIGLATDADGGGFFDTLFVSEEDFLFLQGGGRSPSTTSEASKLTDEYQRLRTEASARWQTFRQSAAAIGVVPGANRLLSTQYTVMVGKDGLQTTALTVDIETDKGPRSFVVEACVLLDGNWYALTAPRWK